MVGAEAGIVAEARSLATADIRESKRTQGHAVLWTERGHRSLLRVEIWDCLLKGTQAKSLCHQQERTPARCRRYKTETPRLEPGRSTEQGYYTTTVTEACRISLARPNGLWSPPVPGQSGLHFTPFGRNLLPVGLRTRHSKRGYGRARAPRTSPTPRSARTPQHITNANL